MAIGGLRIISLFLTLATVAAQGGGFDQDTYDRLFPLSAKACSLTQVDRKDATNGGAYGHAVIYLRGACLDKTFKYPQIRLCTQEEMSHPETSGTGISVNKVFSTANWVGIPGYSLFFHGGLSTDSPLTSEVYKKLKEDIKALGYLDGITAKSNFAPGVQESDERAMALIDESLDTDFALSWGRDAYCMNYPLSVQQLNQGIEFLNLLNVQFADPSRLQKMKPKALAKDMLKRLGVDFQASEGDLENRWNGLVENCSHTTHNTLAAMSIDSPKNIRPFLLAQPFHLTTPSDSLVELYTRAQLPKVDSQTDVAEEIVQFCRSSQEVDALETVGFSNYQPGIIGEHIPFHAEDNQLYYQTLTMPALLPWNLLTIKSIRSALMEPQASDIESSLGDYRKNMVRRLKLITQKNSLEEIMKSSSRTVEISNWLQSRSDADAKLMSFETNRNQMNACATTLVNSWISTLSKMNLNNK